MTHIGCGPGWLTFGPLDFFFPCCVTHDEGYTASAEMYAKAIFEGGTPELKAEAVRLKVLTDEAFFKCVRSRINSSWLLFKPLVRVVGTLYIGMVAKFSNRYWVDCVAVNFSRYMLESGSGNLKLVSIPETSDPFIQALLGK